MSVIMLYIKTAMHNKTGNEKIIFKLVFLSLFLLLLFLSPIEASETITDFHSDIIVHQDASMTVRETINVRSEGIKIQHGIYRDFPTRYKDSHGLRYIVGFEVIEVMKNGNTEPYFIKDISNGKRVYIGDKDTIIPPGEYVYALVYRTNRQLGFFKDHDELYWNVTGNGWEFPIDKVSASVELPGDAKEHILWTDAYTGRQGSREKDFNVSVDSDGIAHFYSTRQFSEFEGLTIVVAWKKGFVTEPDISTKLKNFSSDNIGSILGLLGIAVLLVYYLTVWVKFGKDPEKGVIVTRYTPPNNITPAVMRYILKMGYDDKIFTSAVIDMAVKGHIKIIEDYGEYGIQKLDDGKTPLAPEEDRILKKLLDTGKEITLEQTNHAKISSAIAGLKNILHLKYEKIYFVTNITYFIIGLVLTILVTFLSGLWESIAKGTLDKYLFMSIWLSIWSIGVLFLLYSVIKLWRGVIRHKGSRKSYMGGAIFLTVFSIPFFTGEIAGLYFMSEATSIFKVMFMLVAVFINVIFYHLLKAPTLAGRKLLDSIEGFRVFLVATEKDRLNMMNPPQKTPELFEKYLPYALALDIEQQWAEQFSDILSSAAIGQKAAYAPLWFSGTTASPLATSDFFSSLGSSFSDAISSSSTAPGSSSGGGGGGSSGGGGGGGGGGGW
jgi:uncharacterized membrane protein YgcG